LVDVGAKGDLGQRWTQVTSSSGGLSYGADQALLGGFFEDIPDRTAVKCLNNKGTAAMHGEGHDPGLRRALTKNPQRLQAVQTRHHQVEHQDVGFQIFRQPDRF
jgi:hypothetical protein